MFGKKPEPKKKSSPKLSEKEKATRAGEPWVSILNVDINPEDINNGAFEMDWNDKFVLNLIKAGYKQSEDDTDEEIVDRWFQTLCKTIGNEQGIDVTGSGYVQINRRDDGKTEVS